MILTGEAMQVYPQKKITRYDIVLIIILLFAAVGMAVSGFFSDVGDTFKITASDGSITCSLSENRIYTVSSNGYTLTVTVSDGKVSVTSSDCPDHTCERSSPISRKSETIVCVPSGVVIEVTEDGESIDKSGGRDEDFVIG